MTGPRYLHGFGNEHHSEAVPGTLPWGQNGPQHAPQGLYTEQLSATAFTEPRVHNRRTWVYRILPSARHGAFRRIDDGNLRSAPLPDGVLDTNRLRWDPMPDPGPGVDFLEGLFTLAANGAVVEQSGIAIHTYHCTRSMHSRYLYDLDGELVLVPQSGRLRVHSEVGILDLAPGEIAVIGRAIGFRVELLDPRARGYVLENYGAYLTLPELGPIGANGLAHPRDFQYPVAAYEDRQETVEVVRKFGGHLWATELDHSPLDVVAWHGTHGVYKYDTARFHAMSSVTWDHPDPSIFTLLTAPSERPGVANVDVVVFPPRWNVIEHSFRPPYFHRNTMTEFMGLVTGVHDAKAEGFVPGGASLHNMWSPHGPDAATYESAVAADLAPQKLDGSLPFMFETRRPLHVTNIAHAAEHRQPDYDSSWAGLRRHFRTP